MSKIFLKSGILKLRANFLKKLEKSFFSEKKIAGFWSIVLIFSKKLNCEKKFFPKAEYRSFLLIFRKIKKKTFFQNFKTILGKRNIGASY